MPKSLPWSSVVWSEPTVSCIFLQLITSSTMPFLYICLLITICMKRVCEKGFEQAFFFLEEKEKEIRKKKGRKKFFSWNMAILNYKNRSAFYFPKSYLFLLNDFNHSNFLSKLCLRFFFFSGLAAIFYFINLKMFDGWISFDGQFTLCGKFWNFPWQMKTVFWETEISQRTEILFPSHLWRKAHVKMTTFPAL